MEEDGEELWLEEARYSGVSWTKSERVNAHEGGCTLVYTTNTKVQNALARAHAVHLSAGLIHGNTHILYYCTCHLTRRVVYFFFYCTSSVHRKKVALYRFHYSKARKLSSKNVPFFRDFFRNGHKNESLLYAIWYSRCSTVHLLLTNLNASIAVFELKSCSCSWT